MHASRRKFLHGAGSMALGFLGLHRYAQNAGSVPVQGPVGSGYGPLRPDPGRIFDLPAGFDYQILSRTGERMDDGFLVPGAHDGAAAFAGRGGKTILIRNHELLATDANRGPFGANNALPGPLERSLLYDGAGQGGTTTLIYDTRRRKLDRHFLSLAGTVRNCAGGPTPWNAWISSEETVQRANTVYEKDHGFNFEVPASAESLVEPVPLKAMGRFSHEAIAVEPSSGVIYQTEDRADGLLYRFIPNRKGNLRAGGRLQALKIRGMEGVNTSNQMEQAIAAGRILDVDWIDLDNVESPLDDLRSRGASRGAARFSRGEGIWADRRTIYFACTDGGAAKAGQIWRYTPSRFEGADRERQNPGRLELFIEPNDKSRFENADNITVSPWGDLIVSEDGPGANYLVGITPNGELYPLARNAMNESELAGATFSPDATTLFVNIQRPGLTLAITGAWKRGQA